MSYYIFEQNNSGGVFVEPAVQVVVEATCEYEAVKVAISNGIYFDPELKIDCECCGPRWNDPYPSDEVPEPDRSLYSNGVLLQLIIKEDD